MSDRYRGLRESNARRHAARRDEIASGEWDCSRCGRHLLAEEFNLTYTKRGYPGSRRTVCKLCETVQKYGLNARTWQELLDSQGGTCAVCGGVSDRWCVDHNHACCPSERTCGDCVRAILCNSCNSAEGMLKTPENARRLADYMELHCAAVGGAEAHKHDPVLNGQLLTLTVKENSSERVVRLPVEREHPLGAAVREGRHAQHPG